MFDDVNFANHMYTKISDLKLNKSISDSEEKIKYNENNFSRMEEDTKIKSGSKNTDFDYLYYEENNNKNNNNKSKKKKNKVKKIEKKEENETNKEIRFYIYLFILFYFLNSYFVINFINSYKIQYYLSLAIRSSLFLIFYYIIKRFS
jgi:hypothetical protein